MPPTLTYFRGSQEGVLPVGDEPILIGRAGGCELRMKDDPLLDRRHAIIEREEGRHWITDLDSKRGTWVNGRRIGAPHPLAHRDRIMCGGLRLEYYDE